MTSARTRDRLIETLRSEGIRDEVVLDRLRDTPRHLFVDEALASRAYENTALPIGYGQTISQPYIVALMTEALVARRGRLKKVLEIGVGCGYQTAVLAPLVQHVYGIERLDVLLKRARTQLRALKIHNVSLRHGNGWQGWASQAPFQGILVAAAAEHVPERLLEQLDEGGRLIIPVGPAGLQELVEITRLGAEYHRETLKPVSFVPLVDESRT